MPKDERAARSEPHTSNDGPQLTPESLRLLLRGTFGYLAHEIAGAVNLIVGWSSMLEQADVPEPQKQQLQTIGRAAQNLVQHTREIVERIPVKTGCHTSLADVVHATAARIDDIGLPVRLVWAGAADVQSTMCEDVMRFLLWQTLQPLIGLLDADAHVAVSVATDQLGRGAPVRFIITPPPGQIPVASLPAVDPFRDGKTASAVDYFVVNRILREHSGRLSIESNEAGFLERVILFVPVGS